MISPGPWGRLAGALALAFALASCGGPEDEAPSTALDFPGESAGKADVFGRALAGIAAPYNADLTLSVQEARLASEMGFRRQVAWNIVLRVLDPVPLLGIAELGKEHEEVLLPDGEVPTVPRWQTWYGVDDFKRIFHKLFEDLGTAGRAQRLPFPEEAIEEAFLWNAGVQERSERWPLERFLKHVSELGVCPAGTPDDQCALSLQSNFSGATAGNARISYSPGTMTHLIKNYGAILDCLESLDTLGIAEAPEEPDQNFSLCFESEFPSDAVLMKAHWVRSAFNRKLPAFDTDAASLLEVIGETKSADWAAGDRELDPTPDEVFTIRLRNSDTYRLAGLHIMTKELRHWTWITLWWSDKPDVDFGADRPDGFKTLDPVWSHYKMGVVVDYEERDPDPTRWFSAHPTLAEALTATNNGATWSSNPYIEHGRGNARTNCIGCHQHGGSTVGHDLDGDEIPDPFDLELVIDNEGLFPKNGRQKIRSLFPADYLWSIHRVDNLAQVLSSQVGNFDNADLKMLEFRIKDVLGFIGDQEQGATEFDVNCSVCHGDDGTGSPQAPSLFERVPQLTDTGLLTTLIQGKGNMPSWGHFSDQQLADLRAFLRASFEP